MYVRYRFSLTRCVNIHIKLKWKRQVLLSVSELDISTHLHLLSSFFFLHWQVNELLEILSSANKAHELFMHSRIISVSSVLCTIQKKNPLQQRAKWNFINKHYRVLLNIVCGVYSRGVYARILPVHPSISRLSNDIYSDRSRIDSHNPWYCEYLLWFFETAQNVSTINDKRTTFNWILSQCPFRNREMILWLCICATLNKKKLQQLTKQTINE